MRTQAEPSGCWRSFQAESFCNSYVRSNKGRNCVSWVKMGGHRLWADTCCRNRFMGLQDQLHGGRKLRPRIRPLFFLSLAAMAQNPPEWGDGKVTTQSLCGCACARRLCMDSSFCNVTLHSQRLWAQGPEAREGEATPGTTTADADLEGWEGQVCGLGWDSRPASTGCPHEPLTCFPLCAFSYVGCFV